MERKHCFNTNAVTNKMFAPCFMISREHFHKLGYAFPLDEVLYLLVGLALIDEDSD